MRLEMLLSADYFSIFMIMYKLREEANILKLVFNKKKKKCKVIVLPYSVKG